MLQAEFVAINPDQIDRNYAYYLWGSEKVTDRLSANVQSATRSHQRVNSIRHNEVTLEMAAHRYTITHQHGFWMRGRIRSTV